MNPRKLIKLFPVIWLAFSFTGLLFLPSSTPVNIFDDRSGQAGVYMDSVPANCSLPVNKEWIQQVTAIKWVAYSSPNANQKPGFYQPTTETIYQDLLTLKKAGFTGLVTYGSIGIMGKQFLMIAQSLGYEGIIMGIWAPDSEVELKNAKNASGLPIVLGYNIGNEGLSGLSDRYSVSDLCLAISDLRASTGKPVATSEAIDTYYRRPDLLSVGDWVFVISHSYWHSTKYPEAAIQWEAGQYSALREKTDHFVFFKEVGLPTAGAYGLSEANQDLYYRGLAETNVQFAYFEGFDQPSKAHAAVEPHWGIFHADHSPKLLGWNLMGYQHFILKGNSNSWALECSKSNETDCSVIEAETTLLVGDGLNEKQYRSFLTFNTANLPDNAIITSVKLKVRSAGVMGLNPIAGHQDLKVDICVESTHKTFSLQRSRSHRGVNCNNNVGTGRKAPNDGWYVIDFNSNGFPSINLKGITQFRLRIIGFSNKNVARSYITFSNGNYEKSDSPILVVRYYIP